MDAHQLDLAFRDADASWCSCVCGWVSETGSQDDVQALFAAHVVERAFNSPTTI